MTKDLIQNYLSQAATLAAQIDPHRASPNPRVGCLVVQEGKIIAQGVHEFFGGPHAEVNALKNETDLSNAEVFISLEPCHHFIGKKTPSCSDLLLKLKPKKVWVGALDPQFQGQNIKQLQSNGLDIEYAPNLDCQALNPFFKTWINQKKPFITLKVAQSLNGKITSPNQHITNELSRQKVHEMRAHHSAILTTTQTVLNDNPRLDIRLKNKLNFTPSNPEIIILGTTKLSSDLNIFQIPDRKIYQLDHLEDLTDFCLKNNIDSIMTECGGNLNTQLLEKDLVDEIQLFVAPTILGTHEKNSFDQDLVLKKFKLKNTMTLESDLVLTYQHQA